MADNTDNTLAGRAIELANTAVTVLTAVDGLGIIPGGGVTTKIIAAIGKALVLVKAGDDAANEVITELNDLTDLLKGVQTQIDAGAGETELNAAFTQLSTRGQAAIDRIHQAAVDRGLA